MEKYPELDIDHGPPIWLMKIILMALTTCAGFVLGVLAYLIVNACGGLKHYPAPCEWIGSAAGFILGLYVLYLIYREERK